MVVQIRQDSMLPALAPGSRHLVIRGGAVRPGDMVVFRDPEKENLTVKRCILTENQIPSVQNGYIITSGGRWFVSGPQREALRQDLPGSGLFLVGDNQFNSRDSRDYGRVARERIIGRVWQWSRSPRG